MNKNSYVWKKTRETFKRTILKKSSDVILIEFDKGYELQENKPYELHIIGITPDEMTYDWHHIYSDDNLEKITKLYHQYVEKLG